MSSTRSRFALTTVVVSTALAGCHGDRGSKVSLSYHPPAGASYHYTLEQHNAMKFEGGPMAQMPEQKMTMRMYISQTVTGPTADGMGVTVTFDSTNVESPNLAPGALTAALQQIKGVKSNVVYDARMGVVHSELSATSAMSSPMTDQLTRGVKAMTFMLPDHPVGVGDSWTTETEMPMGQAGPSNTPAKATTKLTVKEIHPGADTTVLMGVETTYPSGPISVNQQGQQLTLKVSGNLAGEQLFSLTRGTAVRSSMEGTMKIHITGGTTGPNGMDMAMQQATLLQLNDAK